MNLYENKLPNEKLILLSKINVYIIKMTSKTHSYFQFSSNFQLSSKIVTNNTWHPELERFLHTLPDYEIFSLTSYSVMIMVPQEYIESLLTFLTISFGSVDKSVVIEPLKIKHH